MHHATRTRTKEQAEANAARLHCTFDRIKHSDNFGREDAYSWARIITDDLPAVADVFLGNASQTGPFQWTDNRAILASFCSDILTGTDSGSDELLGHILKRTEVEAGDYHIHIARLLFVVLTEKRAGVCAAAAAPRD